MFKTLIRRLRQHFCRHRWRDSQSLPGMTVCRKCGRRRFGIVIG